VRSTQVPPRSLELPGAWQRRVNFDAGATLQPRARRISRYGDPPGRLLDALLLSPSTKGEAMTPEMTLQKKMREILHFVAASGEESRDDNPGAGRCNEVGMPALEEGDA
jgi:hypothetical protein